MELQDISIETSYSEMLVSKDTAKTPWEKLTLYHPHFANFLRFFGIYHSNSVLSVVHAVIFSAAFLSTTATTMFVAPNTSYRVTMVLILLQVLGVYLVTVLIFRRSHYLSLVAGDRTSPSSFLTRRLRLTSLLNITFAIGVTIINVLDIVYRGPLPDDQASVTTFFATNILFGLFSVYYSSQNGIAMTTIGFGCWSQLEKLHKFLSWMEDEKRDVDEIYRRLSLLTDALSRFSSVVTPLVCYNMVFSTTNIIWVLVMVFSGSEHAFIIIDAALLFSVTLYGLFCVAEVSSEWDAVSALLFRVNISDKEDLISHVRMTRIASHVQSNPLGIKVFGLRITFGIVLTILSAFVTAIVAAFKFIT